MSIPSPDIADISRSGRVRKKNSLLAGYESLDAIEKPKLIRKSQSKSGGSNFRRNFLDREDRDDVPARVTLKVGDHYPKKSKKRSLTKTIKYEPIEIEMEEDFLRPDLDLMLHEEGDGDLEIDLPLEYDDSEMPILAAEEIIDEEMLDAEDGATEITKLNSISRIKSQAESTYMMEKSRKGPPGNVYHSSSPQTAGSGCPRPKVKKKKKVGGTPRATAYVLWAKEYRTHLTNKYPSMDFAMISRKLGELWATIPDNQKKMWKSRAAKDSKKGENIKNSAPKLVKVKPAHTMPRKKSSTPVIPTGQITPFPIRKGGGSSRKSNKKNSLGLEAITITPTSKTKLPGKSVFARGSGSGSTSLVKKSERKSPGKSSSAFNNLNMNDSHSVQLNSGPGCSTSSSSQHSPKKEEEIPSFKPTSTTVMDVAAHFSLLGESMGIIGERLKEHEGTNVSGSLSVLLDSFLCATGPLLCLIQQVPELNHIPPEKLSRMLDSIAYLMPGL